MTEHIKLGIQDVLDTLMAERLLPFQLTAQKVTSNGSGNYVVPFYDSRIHSFEFNWTEGDAPFDEVVRTSILARIKTIDSPLRKDWTGYNFTVSTPSRPIPE
jgi:hypothetical protein